MPEVRNKETGAVTFVDDAKAAALLQSGRFELASGGGIEVRSTGGSRVRVDPYRLGKDTALTPVTGEERIEEAKRARWERDYASGIGGRLKALGEGFVSGATFGLADPLLEDEATQARRELLGGWRGVGEVGGILAPALLSGGSSLAGQGAIRGGGGLARAVARYTPAGATARLGGSIARGGGLARTAGGAAVEGAIGNAGYYLSDVALGKRELSAEGFVGAMGEGALWGGGAGAAFHGLERGFVRARSMFPKLAGKSGKATVEAAEETFQRAADDAVTQADDLVARARAKLDHERTAIRKLTDEKAQIDLAVKRERLAARRAAEAGAAGGTADDIARAVDDAAVEAASAPTAPRAFAEGSGEINVRKLEQAVDNFEARRLDVRNWIDERKAIADKGRWVKRTPEGGKWLRSNADLNVDIVGKTPDEVLARRRPSLASTEETIAVRDDYDDLLRRAAASKDDATRERLIQEAVDLEMGAFDAAPGEFTQATLDARKAVGLDAQAIARQRVDAELKRLAKMTGEEIEHYLAGTTPPGVTGRIPMSQGDRAFAEWDKALARSELSPDTSWMQRDWPRKSGRLVDDADDAIRAIGEYEKAHADLVEALGDMAPEDARASASEYRKAVEAQARKTTDRMAQIADDIATVKPDAKLKTRKAEIDVEIAERKIGLRTAQDELKAARAAVPKKPRAGKVAEDAVEAAAPEGRLRGAAGKAADIGMALEVLQAAGIAGLPDVSNLPVVGPLLSMYLKVRAARAVLGRLGGKVSATAEARVAQKAAGVRDRAASAVDRMLGLAERGIKASKPAAGLSAARLASLNAKLFDDGIDRGTPKDAAEAVKYRMEELSAAVADPEAVKLAVRRQLRDAVDPDIVAAIEAVQLRKLQYLASKMPKEPPPTLLGRKEWRPSKVEVDRFARYVHAAEKPATVFETLATGTITPEEADALRSVYPELYGEAQMRLIERSADVAEALPYQQTIKLSVLFDAPLVPSMRPERIAALQAGAPQAPEPKTPKMPSSGVSKLDSLYMTPDMRRAMR